MINYIVEENKISTIFYKNKCIVDDTYEMLITKIFKAHFFNYKYYKNMLGKILGLKSGVPIYLNRKLMLIKFKNKEKIYYINYFAINLISYNDNTILIILKNGDKIFLDKEKNNVKKKMDMASSILEYVKYLINEYY